MTRRRGLRVIAGSARGRRLESPPTHGTRPMADRVRESLFSALDSRALVRNARVLDLYAGSGSLAAEALSRGAETAVLVESDRSTSKLAANNLEGVGLSRAAHVVTAPVEMFLAGPNQSPPFDLAFCDPPYALGDDGVLAVLDALVLPRWLEGDATIVVHRQRKEPPVPHGWTVRWSRPFGDSLIVLIRSDRQPSL